MIQSAISSSDLPTRAWISVRSDPSALPRVLDGRYELRQYVAQGGMGQVFLAHDNRLKRYVAIKQLHPALAQEQELRTMFRNEAEIMATLHHPNVVAVHDTGGWDALPYLVMPFHQSLDLERFVAARGGLLRPIEDAVGLLEQACSGIQAMHDAGLIHGDIKPRNILVSEDFELLLVDLGLSRSMGAPVDRTAVSGTPGYLPPELIRRSQLNPALAPKLDVYSLGVTAYWLLTGKSPWGTGDAGDLLQRQLEDYTNPPSQIASDLDPRFDEPILRALDGDPRRRPEVEELRTALRAASKRGPSLHPPFIVVVDDDSDSLAFFQAIIGDCVEGAEVVATSDPNDALSIIDSRPPDLVITDLQMPGINGVEIVASLRGRPKTASTPVIAVTGVGGAADWRLLRDIGVDSLVVKPVTPRVLRDAILGILEPEDVHR